MALMGIMSPLHAQPVYAEFIEIKSETLEEQAERIALEYEIATTTLFNLVKYESDWDPKADNGFDRGLVQINRTAWKDITDEQAFDPEFSLRFAAQKIKEDKEDMWTVCNCYSFAKAKGAKLPPIKSLKANSIYPKVGGVVIFDYAGVLHVAYVEKVSSEGIHVIESNLTKCAISRRVVDFNDPKIIGYWSDVI